MKNWKCFIGATLLTPACVAVFFGFGIGILWIMDHAPTVFYIFTGIGFLVILVGGWFVLFDHCKKWQKKKGKEGAL